MTARMGRFTSLGSRSSKVAAAGIAVVCAVMVLAGCGGSSGSATDASTPVIRGDVAATTATPKATVRTVTFDANGGRGMMSSQSASTSTALNGNIFSRWMMLMNNSLGHWNFLGWATTPTGDVAYADGAAFPFTADATLYARWAPQVKFFPFSLYDGTGYGTMPDQTATSPTPLTRNTFTRPGHVFRGWSSYGGGTANYADGALYPFTEPVDLYALWDAVVSFDANGGNGTMPDQTAKARTTLALNTFTRPGYVFDGWRDAGGVWWPDGAGFNFPPSGPHTMYAQWKPVVSFDANGGNGTMPDQTAKARTTLALNTFTRPGYAFDGWATTPTGLRAFADGASYPFDANATLYARWLQIPTVTFDANGGNGSLASQSASKATALTQNAGAINRSGYTFNGWNASANGNGTAYADGASYPFIASATLYARWACTPLSVTVSGKRVSHNRAEVTFSASSSASPWTSFTANSTVDGETATVSQSSNRGKITVNGLRKNQGYRFTVTATNTAGCSYTSETTNRVEQWRNESVDSVLR